MGNNEHKLALIDYPVAITDKEGNELFAIDLIEADILLVKYQKEFDGDTAKVIPAMIDYIQATFGVSLSFSQTLQFTNYVRAEANKLVEKKMK